MNKPRVYLIHGFNVRDGGEKTTDTLRPYFEHAGHEVTELDYGLWGRIRVRLCSNGSAMWLARLAEPGSIVVAHSNGANLVYKAAKAGAQFGAAILINPALDSGKAIQNVPKVGVFFSESDPWTFWARFIPWSDWGSQGRTGYTGEDPQRRYTQYEMDRQFAGRELEHSGIFDKHLRRMWLIRRAFEIVNEGAAA